MSIVKNFTKYWEYFKNIDMLMVMAKMNSMMRKIDAMKYFEIGIYSITVVSFLFVLEYFSGRSSVNVSVHHLNSGFYMDTVKKFYKENNIEIPKGLIDSNLFKTKTIFIPKNYINIGDASSDFDIIKAIKNGQEIGGYINRRAEDLERQIGKYTYEKQVYLYGDDRGFYHEEEFKKTLVYIKSKLSQNDYFVFLSALIFSREISNDIFIENNGDVDLKKVEVIIPSPISKITENRENKILNINTISILLHNIKENTDNINIYLPSMRKNENLSLRIITRENQIEKDKIFVSFSEDKKISIKKIKYFCIGIFILMILLNIYFKGNDSYRKAE